MPATITISQQPTKYNLAVSPNVWVLDSITSNEDAYIIEVLEYNEVGGTTTTLATIQQPANPEGVAMFDVSKILQAQMSIKWVEDTAAATTTDGETVSYQVRYGSVTNDVPTFNGTSAVKYVYNGYLDWRELDWPNQTQFIPEPTSVTCVCETPPCGFNARYLARNGDYLHNYPEDSIQIRSNTYHTLSFFNRIGNWDNGDPWGNNEQPWAVEIEYFDVCDQSIAKTIYVLSDATGLGPRSTFDDTTMGQYETKEWIGTIGAGPQNLKDGGYWPSLGNPAQWNLITQVWGNYCQIWNYATQTAAVDNYRVRVLSANMCYWNENGAPANDNAATLEPYLGDIIYTQDFQVADPCTPFDPITVSFVNQYGVKDYFTFDRRNTLSQSIKRNNYDKILGSWSSSSFSIDQHGRGRTTFSTAIQTTMEISSYWMTDAESKWLEELFTSPHIQVYYDGVWHPAVITSTAYRQKTNSRDGLFQHNLNIQFSNNKKVQRG